MSIAFRCLVLFLFSLNLYASESSSWFIQDDNKKIIINVELFLSSTCPHCHKAEQFFNEIEPNSPWLHIQRYVINEDKNALLRFNQLLTEQKMKDFMVPSIFFCNSRWIGYASNQTSGNDLMRAMTYCKEQIEKNGQLTPATVDVLKRLANANFINSGIIGTPSTLQYITSVAFLDAINPCALFCFAGFIALLFLQKTRKKQIIMGVLFILVIGAVHYFQQMYASVFFTLLPWLRVPAALVGLFTFYLTGQYYRKGSVNRFFFLWVFLLALMLQSYQQTCVMNWSYIFSQWLSNQSVSVGQSALYQLLYHTVYLVPLFLFFGLYLLLMQTKFFSALNTKLEIIGILLLLAIALLLIVYPLVLSHLASSLFIIIILSGAGILLNKFNKS